MLTLIALLKKIITKILVRLEAYLLIEVVELMGQLVSPPYFSLCLFQLWLDMFRENNCIYIVKPCETLKKTFNRKQTL